LLVVGALAYRATLGATEALAAELTADHVKCFMLNTVLRTHDSVSDVRAYLRSGFNWEAELPPSGTAAEMSLVGSRPCLYERGKIAHIMYRHKGVPVSVFMLPGIHYPSELVHTFGHEAVIWADGRRTFVLISRGSRDEVTKVASFVQEALH
jgi:anti-sigma factor RsiW